MPRRIWFDIFALLLVLVAPLWLYVPVILLGILLLPLYIEALVLAGLADVLYGQAGFALGFPLSLVAALLVLFVEPLREYLRIYE